MSLHRSKRDGFTLVEIMVVVAIIGLLAAIAVPNFVKHRATARAKICINNLRILDAAKDQYAIDNGKDVGDLPSAANLDPYVKGNTAMMICPLDDQKTFTTSYSINNIGVAAVCLKDPVLHKP